MKAEVIIIGNEILKGRTHEKNGHQLASHLETLSINLQKMTIIADNTHEIHQAVKRSLESDCDLIFISGGLGPTRDDITKNSLADYFQVEILENQRAKEITETNYRRFGVEWKKELNFYHFFPKEFTPLDNPLGLAPGIHISSPISPKDIFVLPGVPREFSSMLELEVTPKLNMSQIIPTTHLSIRTFGIPEEKIFNELCPTLWDDLSTWTTQEGISSLPNMNGVDIVLKLSYKDDKEKEQKILQIKNYFEQSAIQQNIWHYGNETIEELIIHKLVERGLTISTAESCTGGYIAHLLTNVSGSSSTYMGGLITYSNQQKVEQIQVSNQSLELHGAVSSQVAIEMAKGCMERVGTDFAISITGIAGPGGGTPEKPVGTAHVAIASKQGIKHFHLKFSGDRELLKERFAHRALFHLYQQIKQQS